MNLVRTKKLILIAAILLGTATANAQNNVGQLSLAPTVGVNYSKANRPGEKFVASFVGGVNAEYGLSEDFGASVGVYYSMLGSKVKNEEGSAKIKLNYIAMPILVNYYPCKGLAFKAGVQPEYLLSAKDEDLDVKKKCRTFVLNIPVGVSYELANIVVDLRYVHGTQRFNKHGEPFKFKHCFQASVAYKFKF